MESRDKRNKVDDAMIVKVEDGFVVTIADELR